MTPLEIRNTLLSHLNTNYSTTPVEYENIKFTGDKDEAFISFAFLLGKSFSVIKGTGNITRHTGMVSIIVRAPVLSGSKTAYTLGTEILTLFERERLGSLVFRAGTVYPIKMEDEYYNLRVVVPFTTT